MWQAFELAMAKEFRPLMYARVIGPYDRLRPRDEGLADARRSTDDPAHLDWVRRGFDGGGVAGTEASPVRWRFLPRRLRPGSGAVGVHCACSRPSPVSH